MGDRAVRRDGHGRSAALARKFQCAEHVRRRAAGRDPARLHRRRVDFPRSQVPRPVGHGIFRAFNRARHRPPSTGDQRLHQVRAKHQTLAGIPRRPEPPGVRWCRHRRKCSRPPLRMLAHDGIHRARNRRNCSPDRGRNLAIFAIHQSQNCFVADKRSRWPRRRIADARYAAAPSPAWGADWAFVKVIAAWSGDDWHRDGGGCVKSSVYDRSTRERLMSLKVSRGGEAQGLQ